MMIVLDEKLMVTKAVVILPDGKMKALVFL